MSAFARSPPWEKSHFMSSWSSQFPKRWAEMQFWPSNRKVFCLLLNKQQNANVQKVVMRAALFSVFCKYPYWSCAYMVLGWCLTFKHSVATVEKNNIPHSDMWVAIVNDSEISSFLQKNGVNPISSHLHKKFSSHPVFLLFISLHILISGEEKWQCLWQRVHGHDSDPVVFLDYPGGVTRE